jgi:hypothetical protein
MSTQPVDWKVKLAKRIQSAMEQTENIPEEIRTIKAKLDAGSELNMEEHMAVRMFVRNVKLAQPSK